MKKIRYFAWAANQVFTLLKAISLSNNKQDILINFLPLLRQNAEIIVNFNNRVKFIARDFYDILGFYEIFINHSYSKIFNGLKGEFTLVDVGAYNGDSSLYAEKVKNIKKIISVEPLRDNVSIFRKNVALNEAKKIEILHMAVSNSKSVKLYEYANRRQTGIFSNGEKRQSFIVKGVSLDELTNNIKGKIILKCDVEGAEFDIFGNTSEDILKKFNKVMIEYHLPDRYYRLAELITIFKKLDMKVEVKNNKYLKGFGYVYAYK